MIDSGSVGSYQALVKGVERAGFQIGDIERVILTHGHWDHDGNVAELAMEVGAELWAHDIYSYLVPFHPRDLLRSSSQEIQKELEGVLANDTENGHHPSLYRDESSLAPLTHKYFTTRRNLKVTRPLLSEDQVGGLTFIHTPGHSPDHLCISLDGLLFTGDHILPEITPHPTMKVQYPQYVKDGLPIRHQNEEGLWGLAVYIESLKRVLARLGQDTLILPAHRLFNKGSLNLVTLRRAEDIIDHHFKRLSKIVKRIGHEPHTLEDVTKNIFSRRNLIGGNLFPAFREVVSHIELLIDYGDVEQISQTTFRWKGTENFRHITRELKP